MEGVAVGHNFERGPSKDHSIKVWFKLAQWFLRRRIKYEKFTTDNDDDDDIRRTTDDGRNLMAKTHVAFGQVSQKEDPCTEAGTRERN